MKNLLLSVSLIYLFLLTGLVASAFWTNKWDYQLFNMSLDGVCPVIQKDNGSEYKGFIKRVCEKKTVEEFEAAESKITKEAFQKSLQWELPFETGTVLFSRMGSGKVEDTLWQKQVTKTKTNGETLEFIHENYFTVADGFVYDTGMDRYYDLDPGGYTQLRVVGELEYSALSKVFDKRETLEGVTTILQRQPYTLNYAGGALPWKAIKRANYHVVIGSGRVEDKKTWATDGYTVVCYLPITETNSYLEIDMPQKPVGTENNMCDYASEMGIQGVSLVK